MLREQFDHPSIPRLETDNHANVPALYKRKARSSRTGTLEQLGGPGPFAGRPWTEA